MMYHPGGKLPRCLWALACLVACLWGCGGSVAVSHPPVVRQSGTLLEAALDVIEQSHVNPAELSAFNMLQAGCDELSRQIAGGAVLVQQRKGGVEVAFPWKGTEIRAQLRWDEGGAGKRKRFLLEGFRAIVAALQKTPTATEGVWEEAFARGVVKSVDRYSMLMNPTESDGYLAQLSPARNSWGFFVRKEAGSWVVRSVEAGSEAAQRGIAEGDRITRVNGNAILSDAPFGLPSAKQTMAICFAKKNVTPDLCVELKALAYSRNIVEKQAIITKEGKQVGYLKVQSFVRGSAKEARAALCSDVGRQFSAWVLDLRDNLGGYVDEAKDLLGLWVREKTAFWLGNRRGMKPISVTPDVDCFSAKPLVVLVNHNTASSAELVVGVLQQERRALILGAHTYGKGYVQRTFSLPQGFDLLLTTEKWFLPGPTMLPATGWVPDVVWKNTSEDEMTSASWMTWLRSKDGVSARCATLRIGGGQPVTKELCSGEDGTRVGPDLERQAAGALAQLLTEEIGLQEQAVAARIANKNSTTSKTKV